MLLKTYLHQHDEQTFRLRWYLTGVRRCCRLQAPLTGGGIGPDVPCNRSHQVASSSQTGPHHSVRRWRRERPLDVTGQRAIGCAKTAQRGAVRRAERSQSGPFGRVRQAAHMRCKRRMTAAQRTIGRAERSYVGGSTAIAAQGGQGGVAVDLLMGWGRLRVLEESVGGVVGRHSVRVDVVHLPDLWWIYNIQHPFNTREHFQQKGRHNIFFDFLYPTIYFLVFFTFFHENYKWLNSKICDTRYYQNNYIA